MAKSPTPPAPPAPPPPAPPAPVAAGDWDMGLDIPAGGTFGAKGGAPGEAWKMEAMPVGASKLIEVTVPETLTEQKDRDAYFTEEQRKVYNRVAGTVRRFRAIDAEHGKREFTVRKVNEEKYGWGVRFWRIK